MLILWMCLQAVAIQEKDVAALAADDLEVREKAEAALRQAGDAAIPALHAMAARTGEGALRAQALLGAMARERQTRLQSPLAAGLSLAFTMEGRLIDKHAKAMKTVKVEGEIKVAAGNRILVRAVTTPDSGATERCIVSDGTRVRIDYGDGRQETFPTPPRLTEHFGRCLATTGLPMRLWLLPRFGTFVRKPGDKPDNCHFTTLLGPPGNTSFAITDATLRPGEGGIELAFSAVKDGDERAALVLLLKEGTGALRKRTLHMPSFNDMSWTGTETISSWTEEPLKDDVFQLPPEK